MVSARTIGETEKAMNVDMDAFQIAHAVANLLLEDAMAQTQKDCLVLTFAKGQNDTVHRSLNPGSTHR